MWGLLIWAGAMALIGGVCVWAGRSSRRSGHRSSIGVFEELFHPAAYESHLEMQIQDERQVPRPIPGDPPAVPFEGRAGAEARANRIREQRRNQSRFRRFLRRMRR